MANIVTVLTPSATVVQLKPAQKLYPVISGQVSANLSLGQLNDVDLTNLNNNQTIVYNAASHKFLANTVLTADYISTINGGSF
jgi:hypothetical protein